MVHSFTREELYELVWSEPISKLAGKYGLSDVGFAKACKRVNIPRPPRGYWNKRAAGKKAIKTPLVPRGLGMLDEITIGGGRYYQKTISDDFLFNNDLPAPPEFLQPIADVRDAVVKMVKGITLPKSLKRPHLLLLPLLEEDERRRQESVTESWLASWHEPKFYSRFEKRRLRIINALFTAASKLGFKPHIEINTAGGLSIEVNDTDVSFTIDPADGKNIKYYEREPISKDNPKMRLEILSYGFSKKSYGTWDDTEDEKLEAMLPKILQEIIFVAEVQYRQAIVDEFDRMKNRKIRLEEAEQQRIEDEKQAEIDRVSALEQARVDKLLADADNFRKAHDIRKYVADVLKGTTSQEVDEWAEWAQEQANRIDPVKLGTFLDHV